jgi:hypothetical protein
MTLATLTQKIAFAAGAIAAAGFVTAAPADAAVLGRYTFEGTTTVPTSETDPGITLSNIVFNGTTASNAGRASTGDLINGFTDTSGTALTSNGTGSAAGGTLSSTANTFEFTVTPNSGYKISLDKIQLDWRRSNSAGNTLNIFSNRDGYATALATFTNGTGDSWLIDRDVALSSLVNNLTAPVTFRLIAAGTTGTFRVDNVEVYGSSAAVPTPALLPGLVGLGLGVLRKRKAEVA